MTTIVSIVLPVFNAEKTIVSTLKSIVGQTYEKWELIIVIDGATDASARLVDNFITRDRLLNTKTTVIAQHNKGVSSARNVGLKKAKGTYIALIDSDDQWLPNKLERQVQVLTENPNIDFLATTINGSKNTIFLGKTFAHLQLVKVKTLLLKNFFYTPTNIFKREIVNTVGYFNEEKRYCEDNDYYVRIANKHKAYVLNEPLVNIGHGKPIFGHSGLSGNLWEMEKGDLQTIAMAKKIGAINFFEYIFLSIFSFVKYLRRFLLVLFRKQQQETL